jgi:phage tail-like protein
MARATATDPIRNFKFQVSILSAGGNLANDTPNLSSLGFAVVSGLSVQNEMVGYREGGMNTHPHKFVGQSDFAPVTFSRGVFPDQADLYKWQQFLHRWNQASILGDGSNPNTTGSSYRCDILVKVFDHPATASTFTYAEPSAYNGDTTPGNIKMAFKLHECWPGAYALSDLNAGDSGIMIQQLTIHHEGFVVAWNEGEINTLLGTNGASS